MRAPTKFEKKVQCDNWSEATINLHITKTSRKQIKRVKDEAYYIINPSRIGIDFDDFAGRSHNFIPNLNPADIIQIIDRLEILSHNYIREGLRKGWIPHKFGVELDSRRKLDFDIGISSKSGKEELKMYYEDPLRKIPRFEIGRIDTSLLSTLIRALKEIFVEYSHYMSKSLLLKEST